MLLNCRVGEDLRVPWTAWRSNQSILKEIIPEYSLEGLMLKRKHQYFNHLMQITDSFEKTLILGKIEGRRRRGRQRMRWLDGITELVSPGIGDGQGSLMCCSPWDHKESDMTEWLNWTKLNWRGYFYLTVQKAFSNCKKKYVGKFIKCRFQSSIFILLLNILVILWCRWPWIHTMRCTPLEDSLILALWKELRDVQLINLDVYSCLFSLRNCTVYLKSHGGKCMVFKWSVWLIMWDFFPLFR